MSNIETDKDKLVLDIIRNSINKKNSNNRSIDNINSIIAESRLPLTEEEREIVLHDTVRGKSLINIEKTRGININRVLNEIYRDDKFRELFAIAKQQQADAIAEEIIEESKNFDAIDFDGADPKTLMARVTAKKYKIDGLKWVAGKLKPKSYGERVGYNGGGGGVVSSLIEGGSVNSVNILINTAFENAEKLIKKLSKNQEQEGVVIEEG